MCSVWISNNKMFILFQKFHEPSLRCIYASACRSVKNRFFSLLVNVHLKNFLHQFIAPEMEAIIERLFLQKMLRDGIYVKVYFIKNSFHFNHTSTSQILIFLAVNVRPCFYMQKNCCWKYCTQTRNRSFAELSAVSIAKIWNILLSTENYQEEE